MKKPTLRGLLKPTGHHRAVPAPDMSPLANAIATGDAEPGAMAWCPEEERTTYHALHADGSRRCWVCNTETEAGAR
ncbi:hypothetical protein ACFVWX_13600 [Streptomyces sp. NPDC058220]|uniref:hypothetical protein n=1 Tax=Streptomyces sp. NPDC058220 TaxID=3346387 RepID=UPI0036E5AD3F